MDEFSGLIKEYGDTAYRMALHIAGGNDSEARDLVQDAFLKVWKAWGTYQPQAFKGWLYCVLRNLYVDAMRRKARAPMLSLDASTANEDLDLKDMLAESDPLPMERAETHEVQEAVGQALAGLAPDFRVPVALCDMEGLSYEEIAQVMGCPIGTVRSRIHRGRQLLRKALVHLVERKPGAPGIGEKEVNL